MNPGRIAVLGGTGFVGRHLVVELTRRGHPTRVLTRRRERHRDLLVLPTCELVAGRVHDPAALRGALAGCEAVINLVGVLNAGGGDDSFAAAHAELPQMLGEACRDRGVGRLLHMSALNAAWDAPSEYLRSKQRGEEAVHALAGESLQVSSFRPSVIFGPEDSFFNRFAVLLRLSPYFFPLACPGARFAPVYVGDVVAAFVRALGDPHTAGARFDLCGPRSYTLEELVNYTARIAGLRRRVVGLSDTLSWLQARVLERVPGQPFTTDNYHSLQVDSVCRGENGLLALGVAPTALETVVPDYLAGGDRAGRNARLRLRPAARR